MLVALRGQDEAKASAAAAATAATEAEAVTSASPLSLTLRSPSSPPSACTSSSSSSSSLGFSDGGRTVGPVETPSGSSGSGIVKAAAATVPSTKLSDGGSGGVEKSKGTPSDIPPPSPSTVRASPPPSPSAVGDCSWDGSANPSSVAPVSAAAGATAVETAAVATPGAAPAGTALGDDGSAGEQKSKKSVSSVLLRRVQALHKRYGEFAEENGYVRCEDTEVCLCSRGIRSKGVKFLDTGLPRAFGHRLAESTRGQSTF